MKFLQIITQTLTRLSSRQRTALSGNELELTCFIRAFPGDGQSAVVHLNEWADAVQAVGLTYGGLTSRRCMDVVVFGFGDRGAVETKIELLKLWLERRFEVVDVSELFDDPPWPSSTQSAQEEVAKMHSLHGLIP